MLFFSQAPFCCCASLAADVKVVFSIVCLFLPPGEPSLHLEWCTRLFSPIPVSYSKRHRFCLLLLHNQSFSPELWLKSSSGSADAFSLLLVTEDNVMQTCFPIILIINEDEHWSTSAEAAQRRKE